MLTICIGEQYYTTVRDTEANNSVNAVYSKFFQILTKLNDSSCCGQSRTLRSASTSFASESRPPAIATSSARRAAPRRSRKNGPCRVGPAGQYERIKSPIIDSSVADIARIIVMFRHTNSEVSCQSDLCDDEGQEERTETWCKRIQERRKGLSCIETDLNDKGRTREKSRLKLERETQ